VRLGKIKCAANWVGLWVALQPFLFCEGIAKRLCRNLHCRSVYVCRLMVALSGLRVADNVLPLVRNQIKSNNFPKGKRVT
jgi:hypothetical protein